MNIRNSGFACLLVFLAAVSGLAQQEDSFGVSLITDGAGTWGGGGFVYEGVVAIKNTDFLFSITNVQRNLAADANVTVTPQPFEATATLSEDSKVVSISVLANGAKPDGRMLGNAYNLVYMLLVNVFYEFLDEAWHTSAVSKDSSGQMIMNSRRPEMVITKHFGNLPASQYSDGIVRADRFVVLPVLGGSNAGISIGRVYREGVLTQVHLRQIPKGWRFPATTHMVTVSRKESALEKPIGEILDAAIDREYADSFNRLEIRLSRGRNGDHSR